LIGVDPAVAVAEIVLATSNPGKLAEIRRILSGLSLVIRPLSDLPGLILPEEGDDYERNAIAKARAASKFSGDPALAADSGLEVFGLGGAPGPRSARFGGSGLDDSGRVEALLRAIANLKGEGRRARFVCVAALATPDGDIVTARGEVAGHILESPRGRKGFGYDPVFLVEGRDQAMAEIAESEKDRISHRALAFTALSGAIQVQLRSRRRSTQDGSTS
jgi:XTP/dITP diphosphohydrolase